MNEDSSGDAFRPKGASFSCADGLRKEKDSKSSFDLDLFFAWALPGDWLTICGSCGSCRPLAQKYLVCSCKESWAALFEGAEIQVSFFSRCA